VKLIISWLKALHFAIAEYVEPDQRIQPKRVLADAIAKDSKSVEDSLMPDIYSEGNSDTVPILEILDMPSLEEKESPGFNPYDTAALQKKR
jgi:hypothetical protein